MSLCRKEIGDYNCIPVKYFISSKFIAHLFIKLSPKTIIAGLPPTTLMTDDNNNSNNNNDKIMTTTMTIFVVLCALLAAAAKICTRKNSFLK